MLGLLTDSDFHFMPLVGPPGRLHRLWYMDFVVPLLVHVHGTKAIQYFLPMTLPHEIPTLPRRSLSHAQLCLDHTLINLEESFP